MSGISSLFIVIFHAINNNKAVYFTKMVRQVYSFANSNLKISGPAEGFSVYNPFLTCCTYSDLIQESR